MYTKGSKLKYLQTQRKRKYVFCWVFWKIHDTWYLCLFFLIESCFPKRGKFVHKLQFTPSECTNRKEAFWLWQPSIVQAAERWAEWPICFSIESAPIVDQAKICFPSLSFNYTRLVPPALRPMERFPLIRVCSKLAVSSATRNNMQLCFSLTVA